MEYKKKKKKNDAIFQNPGTRFRASLSSTFITVFPLRFARVSLPHLFRYAALTGTLQARPKAGKQAHRALYLFYCGFLGVSSRVPWQLCARRPTFSPGIGLHQNKIKCNGCCFFCHGWALTGEKFRGRKRRQTVWHKPLYRQKKMRHTDTGTQVDRQKEREKELDGQKRRSRQTHRQSLAEYPLPFSTSKALNSYTYSNSARGKPLF